MLAHLAGDMSRDYMAILKLDAECSVGERLGDDAVLLDGLLLGVPYNVCRLLFFVAHLQKFMKHLRFLAP